MLLHEYEEPQPLPMPDGLFIPHTIKPSAPYTDITAAAINAYKLCYDEEQRLLQKSDPGLSLMHVRILGYMLIYNVGFPMAQELVNTVMSTAQHDLAKAGEFFLDHWIRPFRIVGRTPCSTHPSRPSFKSEAEAIAAALKAPAQDHSSVKVQALARDGYRCVVTKYWDDTSVRKFPELKARLTSSKEPDRSYTECAHIFSIESTNLGPDVEAKKKTNSWAILKRFGLGNIFEELNSSGIHRLQNVLTLDMICHKAFDTLELWFEPIDVDDPDSHRYRLCGNDPGIPYREQLPDEISFMNHAPNYLLPLPSKEYLSLHAACCRVAMMSGAGEYLDKVVREQESIGVLSSDGSSADVFVNAVLKAYHTQPDVSQLS